MDQYSSDGTQSVDSGIIVNNLLIHSTESQRTQTQNDLTRMFRLEDRSVVCASDLAACYTALLTVVSDWRIGRTRYGPGADASSIGRGRDRHRHGSKTTVGTMEYLLSLDVSNGNRY